MKKIKAIFFPKKNEDSETEPREKKVWSKKKKIIVFTILGILLVALIAAGIWILTILNPKSVFDTTQKQAQKAQVAQATVAPVTSDIPDDVVPDEPEEDEYQKLLDQMDTSMMKDIVNVLVIGVDYAPERDTWNGKHDYHSDVMLVLAINFDENKVDMISLPRDSYAKIPGVDGIYKLNASINCGGGWCDAGCQKVCEAAEWELGGIPVDYYYAVNMPVVKELVDTIGGVNYNVDLDFTLAGRSYKKGPQFMDGQAVLDYLRVRKHVKEAGDLNRVNRQKKMLIALFNKMKSTNTLVKLPDIVNAFEGKALTNLNTSQVAALAVFATGLDESNIQMHTMTGQYASVFNWSFCLTNQAKRVQLIKDVYGVKVKQYSDYGYDAACLKWQQMVADVYIPQAQKLVAFATEELRKDGSLTEPTPTPIPEDPTDTPDPTEGPGPKEEKLASRLNGKSAELLLVGEDGHKYGAEERALLASINTKITNLLSLVKSDDHLAIAAANADLQSECIRLAAKVGYTKLKWTVSYVNEIDVDFR